MDGFTPQRRGDAYRFWVPLIVDTNHPIKGPPPDSEIRKIISRPQARWAVSGMSLLAPIHPTGPRHQLQRASSTQSISLDSMIMGIMGVLKRFRREELDHMQKQRKVQRGLLLASQLWPEASLVLILPHPCPTAHTYLGAISRHSVPPKIFQLASLIAKGSFLYYTISYCILL